MGDVRITLRSGAFSLIIAATEKLQSVLFTVELHVTVNNVNIKLSVSQ